MSKNDYNPEVEALFGLAHREFFQYQRRIEPLLEAIARAAEIDRTLQTEHQSPVHHQCQELMGLTMARDVARTRPQYTGTFYERCQQYAEQFPAAKELVAQMELESVEARVQELVSESAEAGTEEAAEIAPAVRATAERMRKIKREYGMRTPHHDTPEHRVLSYDAALDTVIHNLDAFRENPEMLEELPHAIRKIALKRLEGNEDAR